MLSLGGFFLGLSFGDIILAFGRVKSENENRIRSNTGYLLDTVHVIGLKQVRRHIEFNMDENMKCLCNGTQCIKVLNHLGLVY